MNLFIGDRLMEEGKKRIPKLTVEDRYHRDVKIFKLLEGGKRPRIVAAKCGCTEDVVRFVMKRGYVVKPKPKPVKSKKVKLKNVEVIDKKDKLNGSTMLKALVREDFACKVSRGSRARAYAPMYLENKYVPAIALDIASDYR